MEFRFNVNEIFKQPIVQVGHTLIPQGFKGDRRALWDTLSKVTDIVNAMGSASATAQGLTKPITSADRLRNSENQNLYLLIEPNACNGKGAVTGLLKTGQKGLYVFDRDGHHYHVQAPCILDFYVHESRQRTGFGKTLFEHMLQKETVHPEKLAIDRPSDKFLGFLKKHYSLVDPIKQMNNYVVYDGFFPSVKEMEATNNNSNSPNKNMRGANGLQAQIVTSPYGRYGAPRPACSMGQIIHNQSSAVAAQEPTGKMYRNIYIDLFMIH
ncbi:PREDICTED: alpha-tubulin N-acetyltransferase-like isoform X2 [Nicrophorus vespilloides]|uniref:Alpha-tubulin N-acetyltransferase n=1 Tax=Nicrophorus vespilloides TaxID=110193 RepID=A0ABM1NJ51_NICVS|nr:PREDICTED: alpha-tubulin N-acetyltransferase-like isoform X2 [Nicrophorus vespilloides]